MNEPQVPNKMTKDQLKLIALKERIGIITSQYEDQIADMRASFTQQMEAMSDALKDSDQTIENLQNQLRKSSETLQEDDPADKPSDWTSEIPGRVGGTDWEGILLYQIRYGQDAHSQWGHCNFLAIPSSYLL